MKKGALNKGVIGIDEVGRGPLAGPVTVCAVYLSDPSQVKADIFTNSIRDSKKLSIANRNNIYQTIKKNRKIKNYVIEYVCASRSARFIDKNGINDAIHACILSCLQGLRKKGILLEKVKINLDGGLYIKKESLIQKSYVKGDEKFTEIALASVIAKVTRDKFMEVLSKRYVGYFFDKNMGYGTLEHRRSIIKHGLTIEHRKSYLSKILSIK